MSTRDQRDEQRLAMAQRLRDAREYLGLSQEDVAKALNLSRPAITNVELGNRSVDALELDKFATLYRQSVSFLLTGDDSVGMAATPQVAFLARALKGLSQRDVEEVARFATFLKRSSSSTSSKPTKK